MEQNLVYVVFVIILLITFIKSEVSLAILLNINLFRAIPFVDYQNPKYGYYLENDFLLGALLPVLCFFIMVCKIIWTRKSLKLKYNKDTFDFFMLMLTIVMAASLIVSPSFVKSFYYLGIFLVLGLPFYFVTKILFCNSNNKSKSMVWFVGSTIVFALIFSIASLYLHNIALYPYKRMTFPGVYPIPFCLFITLAVIMIIVYYVKPNFRNEFPKNIKLIFSLPILAILIFSIIKTNTRGPVVAMIISFATSLLIFFRIKINPKLILGILFTLFLGTVILFTFFDIDEIAGRFVNLSSKDANSLSPRLSGYLESIKILFIRPLGISVGTFGEFHTNESNSSSGYAHNLFMELISSFGIIGVLICFLIIILILKEFYFLVQRQKEVFSDTMFYLSIILVLFYFFETQISFTLNTHKGWYFSMALYSVFKNNFIHKP